MFDLFFFNSCQFLSGQKGKIEKTEVFNFEKSFEFRKKNEFQHREAPESFLSRNSK